MKLEKLVDESTPKKRKKIKLMITESQFRSLINMTIANPNSLKNLNNEKK